MKSLPQRLEPLIKVHFSSIINEISAPAPLAFTKVHFSSIINEISAPAPLALIKEHFNVEYI